MRAPVLSRLFAALCVASLAGPAAAQRLPATVEPTHYALWFAPDFTTNTFTGTARIDVRSRARTATITLNAAELTIQSATVSSAGRTQTAEVVLDAKAETATLRVPTPIAAGAATVDLRFTGILNDQLRGFYLSTANGKKYAVTQLEATDARRMFPGFDEPAFKATFDLSVTAPAAAMAISNGAVVSDVPGPQTGTHTVTFARTPRMSSYLVALLVGEFACRSGASGDVPVRVCSTPDKLPLTTFALDATIAQLKLLTDYFGIRYPFGKLDIIGIPDFSAGAMENAGAITFRESRLLADETRASLATRKAIAAVIGHELAHQWFGNLVTMKWWDDIWLNEGFATWVEKKPSATWKPEWNVELDDAADTLAALSTDSQASTRAIRMAVNTPAQINEVFDGIAYEKTAAVLRMTERFIGPDLFRKGVTSYLNRFAFSNAAGEDFWGEMTRVTGRPVDRIISSFVTQAGAPVVSVTTSCAANRASVSLTQSRFTGTPGAKAPAAQTWTLPVCARAASGGPVVCKVVSKAADTLSVPAPGCGPVLVNPDAAGYFLTEYAPDEQRTLARTGSTLSAIERLRLAGDAWWMARAGRQDIGAYLDVAATYASETSPDVLDEVAGRLGYILGNIAAPSDRARFAAWIRSTFGPALKELGATPKPGDTDQVLSRRATLITLVGVTGGDTATQADARRLAERYFADQTAVPGTLVPTVLRVAAISGDAALYDRYLQRMKASENDPDEYRRLLSALTAFPGVALAERTLALAVSDDIRSQDVTTLVAGVLGRSDTRPAAWAYFTGNWTRFASKLDPYQGMPGTVGSVGAFCSTADGEMVKQFFAANPVPSSARSLARALERIETCAAVQQRQQAPLTRWLDARGVK
ncbi:MAG: M1 family metallopeptidase [Vicinamibacterales bacterium]